jgi:diphthamide biosynthesis enzyme Dph1/Dph2-like protein
MMIANPSLPAYRYDPYARVITREEYDQVGMRAVRRRAVEAAKGAKVFGVVMGTLGRQGACMALPPNMQALPPSPTSVHIHVFFG